MSRTARSSDSADHSEDTVIVTTLAPEPLIGKVAVKAFLATLMAAGSKSSTPGRVRDRDLLNVVGAPALDVAPALDRVRIAVHSGRR